MYKINAVFSERDASMGIAMIMVVLYHLIGATQSVIFMPFYMGYMGVDIFLFLSGYGLCHAYSKYSLSTFYKRRVFRIFPIYFILALIVTIIYSIQGNSVSVWDWVCNLLTLNYYGFGGFYIEWYLCSLCIFYLIFPILYKIVRLKYSEWIILMTSFLILLICSICEINWFYECALGRLPIFMCGILFFVRPNKALHKICIIYGLSFFISVILLLNKYIATYMVMYMTAPLFLIGVSYLIEKVSIFSEKKTWLDWVGKNSLLIYAANICVCSVVKTLEFNLVINTVLYFALHIFFVFIFYIVNGLIIRFRVLKGV